MRIKHKVWVNTADDTSMEDLHYGPAEAKRLVQTDAYDQWGGGSFNIPVSSNEDLDLGDVDNVKGIYLQSDSEVTVTINGSDTPLQLRKANTSTGSVAKLFIEGDITSVNVANASTDTAALGHIHIWGSSS